jgi:predicted nuclease of predicted toxin-antitoxin system
MKFLADMGISLKTVDFVRKKGFDIVHLRDEGLQRLPDIIRKAKQEQRTILTSDLDFGTIMANSRDSFPSVIIFRLSDFRPDTVNRRIDHVLHESKDSLSHGAIISVGDKQYRVRILPI